MTATHSPTLPRLGQSSRISWNRSTLIVKLRSPRSWAGARSRFAVICRSRRQRQSPRLRLLTRNISLMMNFTSLSWSTECCRSRSRMTMLIGFRLSVACKMLTNGTFWTSLLFIRATSNLKIKSNSAWTRRKRSKRSLTDKPGSSTIVSRHLRMNKCGLLRKCSFATKRLSGWKKRRSKRSSHSWWACDR